MRLIYYFCIALKKIGSQSTLDGGHIYDTQLAQEYYFYMLSFYDDIIGGVCVYNNRMLPARIFYLTFQLQKHVV